MTGTNRPSHSPAQTDSNPVSRTSITAVQRLYLGSCTQRWTATGPMGFFAITTTKETRMTDPVLEDLAVVRRLIDRILKRRPERHRMTTNPAADRALRTVLENHNLPV